jgi:hypothetical protein
MTGMILSLLTRYSTGASIQDQSYCNGFGSARYHGTL